MKQFTLATAMVVALLAGMTPGPATARSVVLGASLGSGTIAPGLTTVPTYQSAVSFSGTFVGVATVDTVAAEGTLNCSFSGFSTIAETIMQGQGVMNGTCSGTGLGVVSGPSVGVATLSQCAVYTYTRVGAIMSLVYQRGAACGSFTGVGGTPQTNYDEMVAWMTWYPVNVNPTTVYMTQGVLQGVGVTS